MVFWNSLSDGIVEPNVNVYWSDDDFVMPSNEFTITHTTQGNAEMEPHTLTINAGVHDVRFRYVRIMMSFATESDWILLSEVQFCGE